MGTAPIPTDCDVTACKAALEDFANAGNKKKQFFGAEPAGVALMVHVGFVRQLELFPLYGKVH